MKIREHLVIVVVAAIAPLAILAGLATLHVGETQRDAFEQRFLERVSALRLALDTEIDATTRILQSLSDSSDLRADRFDALKERINRILASHPGWATIGFVGANGVAQVQVDGWDLKAHVQPDAGTFEEVARTGQPAVSNLVPSSHGRALLTFVVVPVRRDGDVVGFLHVGIEHARWLDLLRTYPIAPDATLTLNDREGLIIARTLNDEQWAGKRSADAYWRRTLGRAEGSFQNEGLEGQRFYTAFSRLRTSSWVLGTGVPAAHVEAALRAPTSMLVLGFLFASTLAIGLALLYARRISRAVTRLADASEAIDAHTAMPAGPPSPVAEVETVRNALIDASRRLNERERALRWAVDREAEARGRAEHESRAKDGFLAMLGHELRNPIAAISAASQVLKLRPSAKDDLAARDILERQVRHLTSIVNDLLEVARLASGKVDLTKRPVDLALVVGNVVAAFRAAGRFAHLSLTTDLAPAPVMGDETRLEQIAGNLLENACKYTRPGGNVHLRVAVEGEEAVFAVRDNGCGIAPELLPHVFELFTQGERTRDRAQGGLGLGLHVVERLVGLHGGSVRAESMGPEQGSAFTVRLPLVQPDPGKRDAPAVGTPAKPLRIVVVEDNLDISAVITTLLRMRGHEVSVGTDGPSGLRAIREVEPDVALVDLGLPVFDGIELARRVRSGGTVLRPLLIALTGYGTERESALAAGFDDFLVKPFDLDGFEAALARWSGNAPSHVVGEGVEGR